MLLENKTCLITGAGSARGLGRAIAMLFAQQGAAVIVLDIDRQAAERTASLLPGTGHIAVEANVASREACMAAIGQAVQAHGRIDVLVNNAGVAAPHRLMDVDDALYDRIMDINMRGCFHMTQGVVPSMRASGAGSIINMASVAGQRGGGIFGGTPYAAAKAAILGYSKACARELGPDGIRVNAVCPSLIDTDLVGDALPEEHRKATLASIPLGRVGQAHEVAGCCLFLASALSSYVTGAVIDVNGGSHMH